MAVAKGRERTMLGSILASKAVLTYRWFLLASLIITVFNVTRVLQHRLFTFKRPFEIYDYYGHGSYRFPNKSQTTYH